MCFFFYCTTRLTPQPYYKGAWNQISFEQKSIFNLSNCDYFSMSVFSSIIFQKWPKTQFLGVSILFFSKTWRDGKFLNPNSRSAQNAFWNIWSHFICTTKSKFAGLCNCLYIFYVAVLLFLFNLRSVKQSSYGI